MDKLTKNQLKMIKTQERLENDKYRTLFRRLMAGLIDSSISLLPATIILDSMIKNNIEGRYLILIIFIHSISIIYNVYFIYKKGATIGKNVMSLKVEVFNSSESMTLRNSIFRELINIINFSVYLISYFIFSSNGRLKESDGIFNGTFDNSFWIVYSFISLAITYSEIASSLFSKNRRAIHDYIGGTIVSKAKIKSIILVICSLGLSILIYIIYFKVYEKAKISV